MARQERHFARDHQVKALARQRTSTFGDRQQFQRDRPEFMAAAGVAEAKLREAEVTAAQHVLLGAAVQRAISAAAVDVVSPLPANGRVIAIAEIDVVVLVSM